MNRLEAEVDEQRTHKQVALVENEHLRMEVEALRSANVANVGAQIGFKEADSECIVLCTDEVAIQMTSNITESVFPSLSCFLCTARAQAAELRFTQLKDRHAELVTSHADLMKKVN